MSTAVEQEQACDELVERLFGAALGAFDVHRRRAGAGVRRARGASG